MNLLDIVTGAPAQQAMASHVYGVVIGEVTNNQDPDGLGRVKIKFPWLSDKNESSWARVATPMAGKEHGLYFLPEVHDEVLVAFDHGDMQFPYVIGSLWNGQDAPPANNDGGKNNIRVIKSRSGHLIRLNDENGKEKIEIIDKSGENCLDIDTASNTITITANKDITLSATHGTIKLDAQNIEITSSKTVKIEAGTGMDVKAEATLNISGSTVNIN